MEKTPIYRIDKMPLIEEPTLPLPISQLPEIQQTIIAQDLSRVPTENVISLPGRINVPRAEFISEAPIVGEKINIPDISTQRMTEGMLLPQEPKEPFWPMAAYGLASALGTALTLGSDPYIAAGIGKGFSEGIRRWADIQSQREELKQKKKYQDLQISLDQLRLDMEERRLRQQEEEAARKAEEAKRRLELWEAVPPTVVQEEVSLPPISVFGEMVIPAHTLPPVTRPATPEERAQYIEQRLPAGATYTPYEGLIIKRPETTAEAAKTEAQMNYEIEESIRKSNPGMTPLQARVERLTAEAQAKNIVGDRALTKIDVIDQLWKEGKITFYEYKRGLDLVPPSPAPPTPTDVDDYVRLKTEEHMRTTGQRPTPGQKADWMREYKRAGVGEREEIKAVEESIKKAAARLEALGEKADLALRSLEIIGEGKKLLDQGIFSGAAANIKLQFNRWAKEIGLNVGGEKTGNTEAYAHAMGRLVGQVVKDFGAGTGLSDADREYAEKIAGGKITLTREAIEKLLDINERLAIWEVTRYNQAVEQYNRGAYFELKPAPKQRGIPTRQVSKDLMDNIKRGQEIIKKGADPERVIQRLLETYPDDEAVIRQYIRGR